MLILRESGFLTTRHKPATVGSPHGHSVHDTTVRERGDAIAEFSAGIWAVPQSAQSSSATGSASGTSTLRPASTGPHELRIERRQEVQTALTPRVDAVKALDRQ